MINEIKNDFQDYLLSKEINFNNLKIKRVSISNHYQINHSTYLTNEIILSITQFLDNKIFLPKFQNIKEGIKWQSFCHEPIFYQNKAYRLIWYIQENQPDSLWILNCFRRHQYEKK